MKRFFSKPILLLGLLLMAVQVTLYAQNEVTVTGVVTSAEDGSPIPYASVVATGTPTMTMTLDDGSFVLKMPDGVTTITVSSFGYKTVELPVSTTKMSIKLATESENLDAVMIVAYGTAKKGTYTGSAAVVDSEVLTARPLSEVSQALTGTTAGVQVGTSNGQPGSAPSLRIRGLGSFNASNDPLIVLDGMPYDNSLSSINPEDIESMTVLKDASSAALYGARAANGVILITTKRGKEGKIIVSAKYNLGLTTRQTRDYETMGTADYMEGYWDANKNNLVFQGFSEAEASAKAAAQLMSGMSYNAWGMTTEELFDANGKFNRDAKILWADDLNWKDAIEQVGIRHDASLNISGANKSTDYYTSIGYTKDNGYVVGSEFSRYSAKANVNSQITKWLKVGTNLSAAMSESNGNQNESSGNNSNPFRFLRYVSNIVPIHLHHPETGEYLLDSDGNRMYDFGLGYTTPDGSVTVPVRDYVSGNNPAIELKDRYDGYRRTTLNAKAYAEVTFLKDFKFAVNVGVGANRYKGWSGAYVYPEKGTAGSSTKSASNTTTWTINQILSYSKNIGKHHVDVMVGHESYDYSYDYLSASMKGQIMPGDNFEFGNYTEVSGTPSAYTNEYNVEGYLSRLNYDYDGKYFASASFRRDGSSRFSPDSRWGNFWSVGAGWRIDLENFMKDVKWVNMLKLRASYGVIGNDDTDGYYPWRAVYALDRNGVEPGYLQSTLGNVDLTWETSKNLDVALEFTLLNSRLNGTVEFFNRESSDLLFDISLPPSIGVDSQLKNAGTMRNRGIEITLDGTILNKRDWRWDVNVNATFLKNKVVELPMEPYKSSMYFIMPGHSRYEFWLRQWAGVNPETGYNLYVADIDNPDYEWEENELIYKGDVAYTEDVEHAKYDWSGDAMPVVTGGFGTNLSWKNWDLNVMFYYQLGGKYYDSTYASLMSTGSGSLSFSKLHVDLLDRWKQPGDKTDVAKLTNGTDETNINASSSTRWLGSSNMLEITSINLGYNVPAKILRHINVSNAKIYFSASNPFMWAERVGMYPRRNFMSGYDGNADIYLPSRTFSFGLNLTF
ncbi:MAG: TonB-dependent receptor [Bacteroidales bacterium]|nr:TonB-dependent receptor [Bacteroidales bacterium]